MSSRPLSFLRVALPALSLAMLPVVCAAEAAPAELARAATERDAPALRRWLAERLAAVESAGKAPLSDASYRTLLAAHEVLRVTGDKSLEEAARGRADFGKFLAALLADREWTEAYLAAGNVPENNPHGLTTLYRIWKADGTSPDFKNYRHLSAAIASAWGAGNNAERLRDGETRKPFGMDPVRRFKFFKDRHKAGRLHAMFPGLKSWELHYVVSKVWSDASYEWLNDNVNIPLYRYPDACWSVKYRGDSDFGDSIQGPLYFIPWELEQAEAENTRMHGGVCGSLSTFGATAASARGIPSYTCGQPGHCAYAVRFERGKWVGGFGGPDGSPHIAIFPGNIHYVDLMEKVFGDDAGLATALAHAARARLHAEAGRGAEALAAMDAALRESPLHYDLRAEQVALLTRFGAMTPAKWREHAEALLATFGEHSVPAVALTRAFEGKFLDGADEATSLAWFEKVNRALARATTSWAFANEIPGRILTPQYNRLTTPEARESLLKSALLAHLGSGDGSYFGKVLEWGVDRYVSKGQSEAFGRAFAAAAAGESKSVDEKKLREAYDKAIVAACEARSIPAFQSLSKAAARFAKDEPGPDKLDKPAGKLVSSEGVIRLSSQAWCSGLNFYNVLNEKGGAVHTKAETTPWFIVELPATREITGALFVKNRGHESRIKRARVSTSVDGATWFPLAETADMPSQWRVDAPAGTRARWVRFEALNDKDEFLHLRNFLVFAKE